jgi:hypothetical protein
MLPVETSLITKETPNLNAASVPAYRHNSRHHMVPHDCTLFAGTHSCISRNVQNNITIKQMLIHWIRRFPESFQIHFRKYLRADQLPANIFLRVLFFKLPSRPASITGVHPLKNRAPSSSVYDRKRWHIFP